MLDIFCVGDKSGLIYSGEAKQGNNLKDWQQNSVWLEIPPRDDIASLCDKAYDVADPAVVAVQFKIEGSADGPVITIGVTTSGRPQSVADWLQGVAAGSPRDVHIEAFEAGIDDFQQALWFQEVG